MLRPEAVGHLDLRALSDSGIPVELGEDHQLVLVALAADSPCVGVPIRDRFPTADADGIEMVVVIRDHELLPSTSRSPLAAGDRLLLILAPGARARLDELLAPRGADGSVG